MKLPNNSTTCKRLLDRSYEDAGAHLRSIMTPERRIAAQQLSEALTGMTLLSLATVTSDCEPLVSPVDGVFFQGKFWFGSSPDSFRFRHIRARPAVSATHTRGESLVVTVHGTAHEIDVATGDYDALREYYRVVYPDFDSWALWGSAAYAWIEAQKMFAASFDFATAA